MATNVFKDEARARVLAHDHFNCCDCGAEMVFAKPPPYSLSRMQWNTQLCTRCFDHRRKLEQIVGQ